ncbi:MAG TPA: polysaccharide deacetylase family protein [Pyrinomonadaceae bacterium]|nr:polysaccharide deacetylase family protein [Pyrinomonadaceae bacterium]
MFKSGIFLVIILTLACLPASSSAQTKQQKYVAITFDDLPVASTVQTDEGWAEITSKLLTTMTRNKIPVVGFVNEDQLYRDNKLDPNRVALLRQWLDAGLELGNHTFSHKSLHSIPLAEYESDVLRGEEVLRQLTAAKHAKLRYFRHPFLHTGRSLEVRQEFESFLHTHGYTIAPVTIDNSEWIFARAYDNARDANDRAATAQIAEAYVPYMESKFAHFESLSEKLFGRNIKQVLLLHANSINADHFGELVAMLKRRGYKFITLAEALTDSAYQSPDTTTGPWGISWIDRWALTRKMPDDFFQGEPRTPPFVLKFAKVESE